MDQLPTAKQERFFGRVAKFLVFPHVSAGALRVFHFILVALAGLNMSDALFTLYWVHTDHAVEANPIFAELVGANPITFIFVKFSLVSLGIALLWNRPRQILAWVGTVGCTVFYLYVNITYHLVYALGS